MAKKTPPLRIITIASAVMALLLVGVMLMLARVPRVGAVAPKMHYTITSTITSLGSLPGYPDSDAVAINNEGWVAGTAYGVGARQAYVWHNGVMQGLGTLPGHSGGTTAAGINDYEQVVGSTSDAPINEHAFVWQNGKMQDLGPGAANGINDEGLVVGTRDDLNGGQAVVWHNGEMQVLGLGSANGVNNEGQVVGCVQSAYGTGCQAFVWQHGKMRILGRGNAIGINDEGWVVGYVPDPSSDQSEAVLWQFGVLRVLGPGTAIGVNDRGEIAGWSYTSNSRQAWVWQNGEMQDLGTLPGTNFDMADTVNDSGQVVGMAGMAGEGDVTTLMAVLWTPFLLRAPPDIRTKMVR